MTNDKGTSEESMAGFDLFESAVKEAGDPNEKLSTTIGIIAGFCMMIVLVALWAI